ncbi:Tetraspanin 39D [Carabus blaptoides fortunei]
MGCATGVVRTIVFIFNFLCALVGLTLLTIGSLYYVSIAKYSDLTPENDTLIPILVISVGAVVFLISFMGCCGVCQRSECMLITYAVILLALFVIQLAAGVIGFLQVKEHEGTLNKTFVPHIYKEFEKYGTDINKQAIFDAIQTGFECCGVENYDDYDRIHINPLPVSCCPHISEGNSCSPISAYQEGCATKLFNMVVESLEVLAYVAVGIAAIELIGSLFAVCLVNSIKNERRRRS